MSVHFGALHQLTQLSDPMMARELEIILNKPPWPYIGVMKENSQQDLFDTVFLTGNAGKAFAKEVLDVPMEGDLADYQLLPVPAEIPSPHPDLPHKEVPYPDFLRKAKTLERLNLPALWQTLSDRYYSSQNADIDRWNTEWKERWETNNAAEIRWVREYNERVSEKQVGFMAKVTEAMRKKYRVSQVGLSRRLKEAKGLDMQYAGISAFMQEWSRRTGEEILGPSAELSRRITEALQTALRQMPHSDGGGTFLIRL